MGGSGTVVATPVLSVSYLRMFRAAGVAKACHIECGLVVTGY